MLFKRIVSGSIGAVFFILVLYLSNYYVYTINIVMAIITTMAINELISMRNKNKTIISFFSLLFSPARALMGPGIKWQTSLYIYTLLVFLYVMKIFIKHKKNKRKSRNYETLNVCFIYIFSVVISVCLGKIVEIKNISRDPKIGIFYVFITLCTAWMCDIGAYIMGSYIGKNKLCPSISPSKTAEGALGGSILSLIFILISGIAFKLIFNLGEINFINLSFFPVFGAPIAILGDLCFSMIKRTSKIKDFSDIIPGHGGILDRFDSVIFTIPYSYIYLHFMPIIY
ncbi:MAG: phosphatidate cytidylyltransferase [Candidatus Improbicoccus pseudotrichonymphae]|uniref:Phosphatidate cytidylyltransferase n=1 Tax=Candidatus Improbicoccus pseudotrichonymphae TaxID=3033792 RepID=A0AA48IAV5_9FIRM|nr:MAG: phosphatidate cytidylyltransferase [Candidatus Improbicoccus pseudotrichonymphae]